MRGAIREVQKQVGITTVYVTHDQEEALAISDRIAIMNEGVIQQIATPEQIYTRPTNVFNAKKQFMNWTEDILVFYKKLPTFNPIMRTDGEFTGAKVQRMNTDRSAGVFFQTGEKKDYVHEGNGGLFYPKTVLEFSNVHHGEKCLHPTQKPVALLEYLIKTYTNEGNIVLDNCMGSGSTGVAALNTNRRFIGMELDTTYCDIAKKRIQDIDKECA